MTPTRHSLAVRSQQSVCAPVAQAQDTLKLRFQARDLGSIDPALTKTGDDETLVLQMFNSLVNLKRGTMDVDNEDLQPEHAEK